MSRSVGAPIKTMAVLLTLSGCAGNAGKRAPLALDASLEDAHATDPAEMDGAERMFGDDLDGDLGRGLDARSGDTAADAADTGGDPGKPNIMSGPKAEAHLFVAGQEVGYIFFTVLAPKQPGRSQMFAVPEPAVSVNVTDYYISLVLDDMAWREHEYTSAVAGRVRFVMKDGRSYAATAADLTLKLAVTQTSPTANEYNLRGTMQLTVPSEQSGREPLTLEVKIN